MSQSLLFLWGNGQKCYRTSYRLLYKFTINICINSGIFVYFKRKKSTSLLIWRILWLSRTGVRLNWGDRKFPLHGAGFFLQFRIQLKWQSPPKVHCFIQKTFNFFSPYYICRSTDAHQLEHLSCNIPAMKNRQLKYIASAYYVCERLSLGKATIDECCCLSYLNTGNCPPSWLSW